MIQKCAYCDWAVPVNPAGYLQLHYKGVNICLGTGHSRSRMAWLLGRIAEIKLEALDRTGGLKGRLKKACS